MRRGLRGEDVVANIRRRLADELGLQLDDVVLISPRTLPKTTSGKVQRQLTARLFESNKLEILFHDVLAEAPVVLEPVVLGEGAAWPARQISAWLCKRIAAIRGLDTQDIPLDSPVRSLGLDSVALVELAADLGKLLDRKIDPKELDGDPTLDQWVGGLVNE
ncbi:MAG: non-ribosomal peptide synthetase [Proteobacteria bacterium]|nr:non-ribosomal peptide synthetase [Pseudomonadota bacterium]